jgi:hypothetical protein
MNSTCPPIIIIPKTTICISNSLNDIMIYGIFVDVKGNVSCKPLKIMILWFIAFLVMLVVGP